MNTLYASLFWFIYTLISLVIIIGFLLQIGVVLIASSPYYEQQTRIGIEKILPDLNIGHFQVLWQRGLPTVRLRQLHLVNSRMTAEIAEAEVRFNPFQYLTSTSPYQLRLIDGSLLLTPGNSTDVPTTAANVQLVDFIISTDSSPTRKLVVHQGHINQRDDAYSIGLTATITYGEQVITYMESDIRLDQAANAKLFIQLRDLLLPVDWLSLTHDLPLPENTKGALAVLASMQGDGRLGVDVVKGEVTKIQADMLFDHIDLTNRTSLNSVRILSEFEQTPDDADQQWLWHIDDISLVHQGQELTFRHGYVIKHPAFYELYVPQFNFGSFASFIIPFIQNEAIREEIAVRQLSGQMHDLNIQIATEQDSLPLFVLDAYVDNASIASYRKMPAASGLSGRLHIADTIGWLEVNTTQSSLHLPNLYSQPFEIHQAQGFFAWEWLPERELILVGELDRIMRDQQLATLNISMHVVPFQYDHIDLVIGMHNSTFDLAQDYIPDRVLPDRTNAWLDGALQQGQVRQAAMAIHGNLRDFNLSQTQFELWVEMEAVHFKQSPHMSAIESDRVRLIMDKHDLEFLFPQGAEIRNTASMDSAAARLNIREGDIHIKGDGDTDLPALMQLLSRFTDLSANLPTGLQVAGIFGGGWQFSYGLRRQQLKDFAFDGELSGGSLAVPSLTTPISQAGGSISFSRQDGYGGSLRAMLGDEELISNFYNTNDRNYLNLGGRIDIRDYIPAGFHNFIGGTASFNIYLSRPLDGPLLFNQLQVSSSLVGIESQLPAPFGKTAQASMPLSYGLDFNDGVADHQLSLDDQGYFSWQAGQGEFSDILIHWGQGIPQLQDRPSGLRVVLDYINLTDWQETIAIINNQTNTISRPAAIFTSLLKGQELALWDLAIKEAVWRGRSHHHIAISYDAERDPRIDVSSQNMLAKIELGSRVCNIDITELHLTKNDSTNGSLFDALPDSLPAISFESMPDITISVTNLVYDDKPLGGGEIDLSFSDNQMHIISKSMIQIPVDLDLVWRTSPTGDHVIEMKITAETALTERLGPIISSDNMSLDIDLAWQGKGHAFGDWQQTAQGEISLYVEDGFMASQQTTLLNNLFNLLNIRNIGKRITGDFSDITVDSLPFNSIHIGMELRDSRLTMLDDAGGEFAFADISVSGYYDMVNQSLNHEVVVSSSVTKVLPLTALLLGVSGLAPLLLSLDMVGSDFLTRFSSAVYQVEGPVTQPQINLVRVTELQGESLTPEELSKRIDIQQPLRNLRF